MTDRFPKIKNINHFKSQMKYRLLMQMI